MDDFKKKLQKQRAKQMNWKQWNNISYLYCSTVYYSLCKDKKPKNKYFQFVYTNNFTSPTAYFIRNELD